jgi:hypothetical protein
MELGIMSVLTVPNLQRKSLQIDLSKDKANVFRTECSVFVCVCVCVCVWYQSIGRENSTAMQHYQRLEAK